MTRSVSRFRHGEAMSTRGLLLAAIALYAVFRVICVPIIMWVARHQDPSVLSGLAPGSKVTYWDMTRIWDGQWYERIATSGYRSQVPRNPLGQAEQSELAFYPLYPFLVKAGMAATGASFAVIGSLLSVLFGAGAMALLAVLMRRRVGASAALCTVAVVASCPPALTFQMTYTESLAMLLLAAVLLALERERWLTAGILGLVIGYERPIGLPLAVVAGAAIFLRWRERRERPLKRTDWFQMGGALAGLGVSGALWPLTAALFTGETNAYSETMSAWRGHEAIKPFAAWFDIFHLFFLEPWASLIVFALMVTTAACIVGPWAHRLGSVLRLWCFAYAGYLFATVLPWSSTLRYLLELFPLAAVLVGAGWRRKSELVVPLTVLAVLINLGATVWWAWNFLRFVPPYGNPI